MEKIVRNPKKWVPRCCGNCKYEKNWKNRQNWQIFHDFCINWHGTSHFYEENSVIKTYIDVKICKESKKMGSKKLWEQQVWEKLKKSAKMTDFWWFLHKLAWNKPFLWRKFSDKDLHRWKNLQGIQKNGFQEAVGTAGVRKIKKLAKKWQIFHDFS